MISLSTIAGLLPSNPGTSAEHRLSRLSRRFIVVGLLILAVTPSRALAQAAPSIGDWDLVCFCNSRVRTPHFIVQMDNNGEILYAARAGTTREALQRAGIRASESQLRLLEDWSLLSDSAGVLRTA